MFILRLMLFVLPLGLDTLGVSMSLGMKIQGLESVKGKKQGRRLPTWLSSALLFSLTEAIMPLVGLAIGLAAALVANAILHVVGALLLIGVGLWELLEEGHEYISRRRGPRVQPVRRASTATTHEGLPWRNQLLLALSVGLDELAIGFSLGAITGGAAGDRIVNPIVLCILIGLQGFLMTLIGLTLGRTVRSRLKALKEVSEFLSAFLLIGLGTWLLVT